METTALNAAIEAGKGISDFGMMAITAGFFLVLSALMMIYCFKWFTKMIDNLVNGQNSAMQQLQEQIKLLQGQMAENNQVMERIAEGLIPETQLRVKTVANLCFDLAVEKACRIIRKIRKENHIADREATKTKIHTLVTAMHEEMDNNVDYFKYRGKQLSCYTDKGWIGRISQVIESEIYHESGENNGRAFTNIDNAYRILKLEFFHNMNE